MGVINMVNSVVVPNKPLRSKKTRKRTAVSMMRKHVIGHLAVNIMTRLCGIDW